MESFSETSSLISPALIQENGPVVVASASETPDVNQLAVSIKEKMMIAEQTSVSEVTIKQEKDATDEGYQNFNDKSSFSIKEEIMIAEEIEVSEVAIKQEEEATEEGDEYYKKLLPLMSFLDEVEGDLTSTDEEELDDNIKRCLERINAIQALYYKCTYCSYAAATYIDLKLHTTYVHERKQFLNCPSRTCYNAAKGRRLERGLRSTFKGLELNEGDKSHNCTHCSYKGATASDLKIHKKDVHRKKKARNRETAKASGSGRGVTSKSGKLKRNTKEHPYVCLRCQCRADLAEEPGMPDKCRVCGFKAGTPVDFIAHMLDCHKIHQCKHCWFTTSTASDMKEHVIFFHTDSKLPKTNVHKLNKSHQSYHKLSRAKAAKARSLEGKVTSMVEDMKLG